MKIVNVRGGLKKWRRRACSFLILVVSVAAPAAGNDKTIIDMQPYFETSSIRLKGAGGAEGYARLINLNPDINAWYLLQLDWRGGPQETYHLENTKPESQRLMMGNDTIPGLVIARGKNRSRCEPWGENSRGSLKEARRSGFPYAPLCNGQIYLLNPTRGHQTPIEAITEFLREKVAGGEEIVSFVRDTFFAYLYKKKAEEEVETAPAERPPEKMAVGPAPALLDQKQADRMVNPVDLGIEIEGSTPKGVLPGTWYAAKDNPGIYVSVILPGWIAPEILRSYPKAVNALGGTELGELVYLVAFDLSRFDLRYALGTTHPGVGWSSHILPQMREKSLPGPDGIVSSAPLVRTGLIDPLDASRTAATFIGGFKRLQGAFKYGPLALKNQGSHYGFLENGVLFSTLQPELATIYVLNDGRTDMKTWTEQDNNLLPRIRYARQNGVAIIEEFDKAVNMSVPGRFVNRWGPGNWSGSADRNLQTIRAGAALQESGGRRFLIYAFFWSATPSAMARVFQAYQCRYAMLLDMNALVHTYLAVYKKRGSTLHIQHLIRRMSEIDMAVKGKYIPRFLGYPDDRDFFYLTRKEAP